MNRKIPTTALTALALILAATGASAQDMRARLGHIFAVDSPVDHASQAFATCVSEATGGSLDITVFPAGQIGSDEALARDLSRGALEFAFLNTGSLAGLDPHFDMFGLPYIATSFDEADAIFYNPDGVLQTTLRETLNEHGMQALSFYELGFRAVTNSKHRVTSVDDMAGLKLRVPGSAAIQAFVEATGAQQVTMPFPELFVALQQGTVDGQDNGASITYNSRLFEAQPYMTLTNHAYAIGAVTASMRTWDALSDDQKSAVTTCADEAAEMQIAENRALDGEFLAQIEAGGTEVTQLSDEEMARFVEAGRGVWLTLEDVYGADRIAALRAEVGQ